MKEVVYKLLDTFTGGKGLRKTINGFPVRLPARYVNYFPSDYEQDNFMFLKKHVKPGDTVLDIGAHIGLFSTAAAQLTGNNGKVYAFEPAAETNTLLKHTIHINQLQQIVEAYSEAMGATSGNTVFYVSAIRGDNSNSMVSYKEDRELNPVNVAMYSIDDFVQLKKIERLAFIKIDVEGAEYDALKGATNTLRNLKPACIVAIHPEPIAAKGDRLDLIYDLIANCGYEIFCNQKIMDKETFCNNRELIDLHILPR